MKRVLVVLLLGCCIVSAQGQIVNKSRKNNLYRSDSTNFNKEVSIELDGKTVYTDYKIISISNDTTLIDTTLTINKDYKFNYIRKDNFEKIAFHNQGQTFNNLAYNFNEQPLFPSMGFEAKLYNYYKPEEIYYYSVPTPSSEIMYRTGLEQGQVLDAFVTMNTSKQLNFFIAYKGLRSLGKYKNALASHGNFRGSFNYHNLKKSYFLRGHMYSFDLLNNENGGLTDQSIEYFETNDSNYKKRSRLDVQFIDANNFFNGKRYYIEQTVTLYSKKGKIERINALKQKKVLDSLTVLQEAKNDSIERAKAMMPADSIARDSLSNQQNKLLDSLTIETKLMVIDTVRIDSLKPKGIIRKDTVNIEIISAQKNSIDSIQPKREPSKKLDSLGKSTLLNKRLKERSIARDSTTSIKADSIKSITEKPIPIFNLKLGQSYTYETKHYKFSQAQANPLFGDAFNSPVEDHTAYQKSNSQLYVQLNSNYVGSLKAKINHFSYNYHYNSVLYYDADTISDKLKGNALAVGADWSKRLGNVYINADANTILVGDLEGNSLKAAAMFKKDSLFSLKAFVEIASKTPEFNKLLYQSDYIEYHWQNNFLNEEYTTFGATFASKKWATLDATYHLINNYTFFGQDSKPYQASESLEYFRLKFSKKFKLGKFSLDNSVLYQKILNGESFFRVPEWLTRNSLYFSSHLFKGDPLYLQTGVTFKYFTAFKLGAYNPLLSEFVLQDTENIGNFPLLDFFVNIQIQRTRIYFKLENFSAGFTGRNYYSAPRYPYRDLTVRFGLVWNFFI